MTKSTGTEHATISNLEILFIAKHCIILCNSTIQSLVKSIAYVHSCPLLHDIFLLYKKFSICLVGTYLLTINQHRSTLTLIS